MTKRADGKFKKKDRNFYPTPKEAVSPLIKHLEGNTYIEPFAGAGDLVNHLIEYNVYCLQATDIEPQTEWIEAYDYYDVLDGLCEVNRVITNPPWDREIIDKLLNIVENKDIDCWLLLSADIAHNVWMARHMKYCKKIVSIGRVKWIPDSKSSGFDNCCWYNFGGKQAKTIFVGRDVKSERV